MSRKFNPEQLIEKLIPLDLENPTTLSPEIIDYVNFYQIQFSKSFAELSYHIGYFNAANFRIVGQYFSLPQAKGTILVMHGYFDHVGLFRHIIQFCLENGYSVFAYDLPGHGLSSGARASIDDFSQYTQTLREALKLLSSHPDSKKLSLIAQSTGAAIVTDYLLTTGIAIVDSPFQKIIFLSPLIRSFQWHNVQLLYFLLRPFVKAVKRKFTQNSHDQVFLDFLKYKDPLQPQMIPVAWVGALRRFVKKMQRMPKSALSPIIIQGGKDTTIDWHFNLDLLQKKFNHPIIYFLEDGKHHLANEIASIRNEIFSIIGEHLEH